MSTDKVISGIFFALAGALGVSAAVTLANSQTAFFRIGQTA
ncbi:MAG: hypothetical protein KatS3mg031_0188 [Chitinophagales bacterium]|nr:MAG: hypothetical protein KatS3mg031_0186 [Chitinophagales bacterium]GIV32653.1 MAG: hypothetical protein KatS3mg031_0188 [Chitinophagales bacterium]